MEDTKCLGLQTIFIPICIFTYTFLGFFSPLNPELVGIMILKGIYSESHIFILSRISGVTILLISEATY